MRLEFRDPLVEGDRPATGNEAVAFSLGTLVEVAKPAEIAIALRLEHKDIHLMVGDAYAGARLICLAQGEGAHPTQFAETVLRIDPESQVEVLAFMPDLDTGAAELRESRNLPPYRRRDRTDYGVRPDFWEGHPGLRHQIGRRTELALALQHEAVLRFDLGAAHGFTPRPS